MFHFLEKRIAEAFAAKITALYGETGPVQTEQPKQATFGEIAVPAAFQLARQTKMQLVEPSVYVPKAGSDPVEPAWKSFDDFKDVVPPRRA